MTIAFWDSSGLVMLLIEGSGRDIAVEIWNDAERNIASRLVVPEVSAAIAKAGRLGRLDETSDREIRRRWTQHLRSIELMELSAAVGNKAAGLVVQYDLSVTDAVHLACALALQQVDPILVTWDRRLSAAAVSARLAVAPVSVA